MLTMNSKRVKEVADRIRPPAVVQLSRRFLGEEVTVKLHCVLRKLILRKGMAAEKLQFVLRKLTLNQREFS